MRFRSLCLSPDDKPSGDQSPRPRVTSSETFIAKYGTAEAAVSVALQDLEAERRTTDTQKNLIDELRLKLPGADKVVMDKKDADELAAFRKLSLAPDKITEAITERDTLKGTVAASERAVHARAAAVAAGLDPEAFVKHVSSEGLVIEMRDTSVTENGKPVTKSLPFLRPGKDDKAVFVAASEYVAKLPAYDQRALKATAPATTATIVHQQGPTGTQPVTGDAVTEYAARRFAPRKPAVATAS